MLHDIRTMMWKERRTLLRFQGNRTRVLLILLAPLLLGTVFPWNYGPDWLAEVPPLILSAVMSVILVAIMVPESFAGERERHTLDTLLASRLPDRAILAGKLITPVVAGWVAALLTALLSLVVVNVANWEGRILFFTPPLALGIPALSLLLALFTAGLGVFVSLRVATVQEAVQILTACLFVPLVLLQVVPLVFRDEMTRFVKTVNGPQLLIIAITVLVVADVLILLAAAARFQRARLSLD